MAEVYRARLFDDQGGAELVAVKKILPRFLRDQDALQSFVDEADVAMLLDHPNIVRVLAFGAPVANESLQDGSAAAPHYIVMEFVDGKDLADIIAEASRRRFRLPLGFVVQVVADLARALDHAWHAVDNRHEPLHLVHRDVSPPNVLVTRTGSAKLADFGISKVRASVRRTQVGVIKGKYGYLSPEQAHARPLDQRSDLYNLGILMFEALSGERLFHADSDVELLHLMRAPRVPRLAADLLVPAPIEDLMRRLLSVDPGDRPADAATCEAELMAAATASKISPRPDENARFLAHLFPPRPAGPTGRAHVAAERLRCKSMRRAGVASGAPVGAANASTSVLAVAPRVTAAGRAAPLPRQPVPGLSSSMNAGAPTGRLGPTATPKTPSRVVPLPASPQRPAERHASVVQPRAVALDPALPLAENAKARNARHDDEDSEGSAPVPRHLVVPLPPPAPDRSARDPLASEPDSSPWSQPARVPPAVASSANSIDAPAAVAFSAPAPRPSAATAHDAMSTAAPLPRPGAPSATAAPHRRPSPPPPPPAGLHAVHLSPSSPSPARAGPGGRNDLGASARDGSLAGASFLAELTPVGALDLPTADGFPSSTPSADGVFASSTTDANADDLPLLGPGTAPTVEEQRRTGAHEGMRVLRRRRSMFSGADVAARARWVGLVVFLGFVGVVGGVAAGGPVRRAWAGDVSRASRTLFVRTTPAGARMTFDQQTVLGVTPLVVDVQAKDGDHVLALAFPGAAPLQKNLRLGPDDHYVAISESLLPQPKLLVDTRPSGAVVTLDGREVGRAPLSLVDVDETHAHELSASAPAHRTMKVVVPAGRDPVHAVTLALEPVATMGRLAVLSSVPGVVFVDGVPWGSTVSSFAGSAKSSAARAASDKDDGTHEVPPGPHDVVVEFAALNTRKSTRVDVEPRIFTRIVVEP